MYRKIALFAVVAAECLSAQGTRLLRHPAVSRDSIAFEYAGDLWIVARNSQQARRLTSTPGAETDPHFSPDGTQIAFAATVGGNTDVYVMPTAGGSRNGLRGIPGRIAFAAGRPMESAWCLHRHEHRCRSNLT